MQLYLKKRSWRLVLLQTTAYFRNALLEGTTEGKNRVLQEQLDYSQSERYQRVDN
jgi:hypothetical protein